PLLVSIFAVSLTAGEALSKLWIFLWFGLGFGIPLLILSLLSGAFQRRLTTLFARHSRIINIFGGLLLIGIAIYDLGQNWGMLRVANAAGCALIGFYLAHLAAQGYGVDAALVGALGVIINSAELAAALPLCVLADRVAPRNMLVAGALLGAVATQLFGISGLV